MIDTVLILALVAAICFAVAYSFKILIKGRVRAIRVRIDFIEAMKKRLS